MPHQHCREWAQEVERRTEGREGGRKNFLRTEFSILSSYILRVLNHSAIIPRHWDLRWETEAVHILGPWGHWSQNIERNQALWVPGVRVPAWVQTGSLRSSWRIDYFRKQSLSDFLRRTCPDKAGLPRILPEWSVDITNTQPRGTPRPVNTPLGPSISTSFSLCQVTAATIYCWFTSDICRIDLLTANVSMCTKTFAFIKPSSPPHWKA